MESRGAPFRKEPISSGWSSFAETASRKLTAPAFKIRIAKTTTFLNQPTNMRNNRSSRSRPRPVAKTDTNQVELPLAAMKEKIAAAVEVAFKPRVEGIN